MIVIGLKGNNRVLCGKEDDCVSLKATASVTEVYRKGTLAFEIDHLWNEETLTCDMLIDDKYYSIWQISQRGVRRSVLWIGEP